MTRKAVTIPRGCVLIPADVYYEVWGLLWAVKSDSFSPYTAKASRIFENLQKSMVCVEFLRSEQEESK